MNILTAEHLHKAYTAERILLDDASFSLQQGEKVGVIGINGMGKSTVLKILAGVEEPDEGTVIMGWSRTWFLKAKQSPCSMNWAFLIYRSR